MNSSGSDQTSAKAPPHLLTLTMTVLQRSKNSMTRNLDVPWSMYVFTMFHQISFAKAVTRATTCGTKHAARLNQSSTVSRRSHLHISPTYLMLHVYIEHPLYPDKRKLICNDGLLDRTRTPLKQTTKCTSRSPPHEFPWPVSSEPQSLWWLMTHKIKLLTTIFTRGSEGR